MRLYVPTNGDKLRLTADWKFTLYNEDWGNRNSTLFERLDVQKTYRPCRWGQGTILDYPGKSEQSLPAGTVLQVDRVYIRKFNRASSSVDEDYDSITFQVVDHPTWQRERKKKVMARFWAKLKDVNTIEFEHAAPPRWSEEDDRE